MQHLSRHQNSLSVGFIMDLVLPNFVEIEIIQDMKNKRHYGIKHVVY